MYRGRGSDSSYSWSGLLMASILMAMMIPISGGAIQGVDGQVIAPPTTGNWTVSGSETYSDAVIMVNGNVSITGSLILDNTTILMNKSGNQHNTIVVGSSGQLILKNGSMISGYNDMRYFLEISRDAYFEMNRSTIMFCGIPDSTLRQGGVYTESRNFYMNESMILQSTNGIIGVNSKINIRDSRILDTIEYGIYLRDSSQLTITGSNLTGCQMSGLRMDGSAADIDRVNFESCSGSILGDLSTIKMEMSIITGLVDPAIEISSCSLSITDSIPFIVSGDDLRVTPNIGFSTVDLLNTSMAQINVEDSTTVREKYRFDARVLTNNGEPAHMADVEIEGIDEKIQFQGLTDASGWIKDMPLISRIHNMTGMYPMDPFELSVLYEGAQRSKSFNMDGNHSVSIDVIINNPVILVDVPLNNSYLPSRTVTVSGRIIEDRSVEFFSMFLDGGNEIQLPKRKAFDFPLSFGSDGEHQLRLRTMNSDGKYGEVTIHFTIDTVFPDLSVTSPEDGSYTNRTIIDVEGTCEISSFLTINDEPVPHSDGSFSYSVFLNEGMNEIVVKAEDKAGNIAIATRNVILDNRPPRILITQPTNGTKIRTDHIIVQGSISHDAETLWINDVEVDFDLTGFSYRIDGLVEGSNRIILRTIDRTGSSSMSIVTIFVDTLPPSIGLIDIPRYTNLKDLVINGTTDMGSTVIINGIPAQISGSYFSGTVQLYAGSNNISISSMDEVGNVLTIYKDVFLDMEKPTFERISPLDRSSFKVMVVRISGLVYDDSGIYGIYGSNGTSSMDLLSTSEEFEWIVNLVPGINLFTIEVIDLAGNIRTTVINYTYDPVGLLDETPPVIFIASPSSNTTVDEGNFTVRGTASDDRDLQGIRYRINNGGWNDIEPGSDWEIVLDLIKGVYVLEVQAIDGAGNIDSDTIKITVVTLIEPVEQEDEKDLTNVLRAIFIIIIILALIAVVFLVIRNQRLKEEWEERKREMKEERAAERGRRPRNRRGPPSDRVDRMERKKGPRMDRDMTRDLPDVDERSSRRK